MDHPEDARRLSTGRLLVLVVATAAPMAALMGNVPLGFVLGDGVGLPAAFLVATLVLIFLSIGCAQMARRTPSGAGFAAYVERGMGRRAGAATGWVAAVSYAALVAGTCGALGYFAQYAASLRGVHVDWWIWSLAGCAILLWTSTHPVHVSVRGVLVLLSAELILLGVLAVAIVADRGIHAFPATSFAPSSFWSVSPGIGVMFGFSSFIGFEGAALYASETRQPERTVARATLLAAVGIGVIYTGLTWIVVGGVGPDQLLARVAQNPGELVPGLGVQYVGTAFGDMLSIVLCCSLLAGVIAAHAAASRYVLGLGQRGLAPAGLGRTRGPQEMPTTAGLVLAVACAVSVAGFALAGADPFRTMAACLVALATVGIVAIQGVASLAIVTHFRRDPERHWLRTVAAPAVGATGLLGALALTIGHWTLLTGSDNVASWVLLASLPAAALAGAARATMTGDDALVLGGQAVTEPIVSTR